MVGDAFQFSGADVGEQDTEVAPHAKRLIWRAGMGVLLLLALAMGFMIFGATTRKPPEIRADIPGVVQPTFASAEDFPLSDHEIVIGVAAFGEAKAYVRRAFSELDDHIVHDRFGDTQVTITHCNRNRCTRVFTATDDQDLTTMHCGGWMEEQEMALLIGDERYEQSSAEIPFDEVAYVVTTWGKWRKEHPQSLVYLGRPETAQALQRKGR